MKAIYGEPIVAHGKTVIPVAKITGCFGIEKLGRNLVVPAQIIHWRGEKLQMGGSTEHSKRFRALVSEIRGKLLGIATRWDILHLA